MHGIKNNSFVVTGGLGFVGSALCLELIRRGARTVKAFDLRANSSWSHQLLQHGVHCIQGDITNKEDVQRVVQGADCIFHLASYGMSGKEMLQYSRVDAVNINGTCHIIDACLDHQIKRLVYMSTPNVVYGGKEIVDGNESLPYFPLNDHVDSYARSKSIAEQLVLKSNGRPFNTLHGCFLSSLDVCSLQSKGNGKCLYTCAIRPAAIYGPGEERHLPRIITLVKLGLLLVKIGSPDVESDWVYVDNLIVALLLASMGLLNDIPGGEGPPVAGGQPYFVSDGAPINSFEFLRPLLNSLDYDLPKTSITVSQALLLGKVSEAFYSILYPWLNCRWLPQPLILPAEVYKVGVTHYFSILKAKEELGYIPIVSPKEGMAATISYFQERKRKSLDGPTIWIWLHSVIGMLAMFGGAFLPDYGPIPYVRAYFSLFFSRSMLALRVLFVLITTAHVGEATYAGHLAKTVDPANARGWFWQTLVVGIFSLRLLMKRAKK